MTAGDLRGGALCSVASESRYAAAASAACQEISMQFHPFARSTVAAAITASSLASVARADLVGSWTVGSGASASFLQFEFTNSNTYLYEVRYDGSLRGDDLFAIVAAAQPGFFNYEVVSFSFGDALFTVAIGSDADGGFGTPPDYLDYWHYWTRGSAEAQWTASMTGFADRVVTNRSWDGWVFNSNAAPSIVPAPATIVLLASVAAVRRRRR